jgi:serine/threonine protein kinase
MGIVYQAQCNCLNRAVAVKMVRAQHAGARGVRKRFLNEARAIAALDHPHIVKVLEIGEGPDGTFLVMELIQGATLEEVIQNGRPDIGRAVGWLISICEAVHYAHGQGIIHRDLKPANIMLDEADRPRVMDFGMAKLLRRSGHRGITTTTDGVVLGTPGYMPPEQAGTSANSIGPHSDVYSLGAILYALLTGRPPFDEGGLVPTILKVRSPEPPPAVRSLRAGVPDHLEWICHKCLHKHPADRFPNAHDLAGALRLFSRSVDCLVGAASEYGAPSLANVTAYLVCLETGQLLPLIKPETVVGRDQECDLVLSRPTVSRRHCRISRRNGELLLEDLESRCGTRVNDLYMKGGPLRHGDRIAIAGQSFRVVLCRE